MSIKQRILSVFALSLLCVGSARALEVKVMSYNIRYGTAGDGENDWSARRGLLIDQLRRHGAGALGLQEALRFQIDEIRAALPHYGEVGIGRDGGEQGEYSCILYDTRAFYVLESGTFWLSETPEKQSRDWGSACVRICTWALLVDKKTDERFYLYNTHWDHRSAEARLKGARLIADRIAHRDHAAPFVLTGDFNAAEQSPPLLFLKGDQTPVPMVDTFRVACPDATRAGTFNGFKGNMDGAKIDYILTAPETETRAADIDFSTPEGRCASDHFPVTATLRFK